MTDVRLIESGHAFRRLLRERGVVGRIMIRRCRDTGTMLQVAREVRRTTGKDIQGWNWFVGVEPIMFERAEAIIRSMDNGREVDLRRERLPTDGVNA